MRNVWCSKYGECLDRAVYLDQHGIGFDCQGCFYEHDQGGRPADDSQLLEDVTLCMKLLIEIFKDSS